MSAHLWNDFDVGVLEMRPKLLLDVQYQRHRRGINFRTRHGTFTVRGENAYEVMLELAPYLTGDEKLSDICTYLSPLDIDMAVALVQALRAYGCVVERKTEITGLPEDVRKRFATQIEFIGQYVAEPERQFERFHTSRVLVCGEGAAAQSLITAFSRNGIKSLVCDRASLGSDGPDELLSICRSDNPQFGLEVNDLDTFFATRGTERKPDLCCYASESPDLSKLEKLLIECRRRQIPFIPAVLMTGKGFVGPVSNDRSSPCWLCLLLRYCESTDANRSASIWRAMALETRLAVEPPEAGVQASSIIANLAAFEAFKLIVGHLPCEIQGKICAFDVDSLECRSSSLLPHPLCPCCGTLTSETDRRYLANIVEAKDKSALSDSDKLERIFVLVNADIGIIERFEDDDAAQSPLYQAAAIVRKQPMVGYSLHSYGDAKLQSARAVLRHYGTRQFDVRRMWIGRREEAERAGHRLIQPAALSGALLPARNSNGESLEWMFALSLQSRETYLVPGAAVYPRSSLNRGLFERVDAGVGIGHTFEEACSDAIHSRAAHECLKYLALGVLVPCKPCLTTLRSGSTDLELILGICEHMKLPFSLLSASCFGVSVTIALSEKLGFAADHIAVAANESAAQSAATALTDLVAMAGGGHASRPLSYYLPPELGYCLDIARIERESRQEASGGKAATDTLVTNMTTDDIRAAGFSLVKAFLISDRVNAQTDTATAAHMRGA